MEKSEIHLSPEAADLLRGVVGSISLTVGADDFEPTAVLLVEIKQALSGGAT